MGGGVSKSNLNLVQRQPDIAVKLALGPLHYKTSAKQRASQLSWLPLEQQINYSSMKMAYQILNSGILEELAVKNPMNKNGMRIKDHKKFAKKPSWLNSNKLTKNSLWNRLYFYNTLPKTLTTQPTDKK